jgi:hypothetical protein
LILRALFLRAPDADAGSPDRRGREEFSEIALALALALPFLGRNHHDGLSAIARDRLRAFRERVVDQGAQRRFCL